ncbi:LOW QUALITY PROTEIN: uncharacterized protein LOC130261918 [Oenanthe melanoleuca]|uniref:LOW QUALITY PROTEIN: uncharacterized protein LOC130261918 n=1 Tax=Oenanthe melanoleuca TaxID=2939378 RepID=UPI0024C12311|nr:LOW QUALITY PROTEIN: uncharacterized protein LOC130261918 [Oenanthe melanoleuca]
MEHYNITPGHPDQAVLSLELRAVLSFHVHRSKKGDMESAVEGPQEHGRQGAKSTQHPGYPIQKKPSNTSQGAGRLQTANIMTLPASMQTSGKLSPSAPGQLNPEGSQKPAQETVTAAAAQVGSDHPPPGAPHSLSKGLQDRLVCHNENLDPRASTSLQQLRTVQPDGDSLRKAGVSADMQNSSVTSRPVPGSKGRIGNQQAQEEPDVDKFRKTLPLQNRSIGTLPLQPSRCLSASTKTTMVRQPGTAPGGSLKHHRQPPPVRFTSKPPTLGNPQGTTNKTSLNPGVTLPWPRPTVKEGVDRKVVLPGHIEEGQGTGHPNQSCSCLHSSSTHVLEDGLRIDQPNTEEQKASGMQARTPPAPDRNQLEEWLISKGRKYKRPPMSQLTKSECDATLERCKAKANQENPEQHCQAASKTILTECLKLVEEVGMGKELLERASLLECARG